MPQHTLVAFEIIWDRLVTARGDVIGSIIMRWPPKSHIDFPQIWFKEHVDGSCYIYVETKLVRRIKGCDYAKTIQIAPKFRYKIFYRRAAAYNRATSKVRGYVEKMWAFLD